MEGYVSPSQRFLDPLNSSYGYPEIGPQFPSIFFYTALRTVLGATWTRYNNCIYIYMITSEISTPLNPRLMSSAFSLEFAFRNKNSIVRAMGKVLEEVLYKNYQQWNFVIVIHFRFSRLDWTLVLIVIFRFPQIFNQKSSTRNKAGRILVLVLRRIWPGGRASGCQT